MSRDSLAPVVDALVARFRRQRPLRSGSLLVTILGDAIAPRGGAITLGSLIRLAEPFGLPERLVRTSVGRLAKDGWLSFRREGRQSEYALTRHGRARFSEATQRIYAAPSDAWDHHWTLVLLTSAAGKHRERIKEEMQWLGFGQVTPGVLAHPSRSVADTVDQLDEMGLKNHAIVLEAASAGLEQDRRLIETGWNLAELARAYRRFVTEFGGVRTALSPEAALGPEQAFIIRTLLIHEYRKIHLRDPLLPRDLLPEDWIGAAAYDLCRELYRRVFEKAEVYISSNGASLRQTFSELQPQLDGRFGISSAVSPAPAADSDRALVPARSRTSPRRDRARRDI